MTTTVRDPAGRKYRLGRNRPVAVGPHFRLKNYLRLSMFPVPLDYSAPAATALSNILGNDTLGDCVIAAGYHMVELESANAGKIWIPTLDQVVSDYSKIGGYVPGDSSTDNGCDEVTALNYWQQYGFANGSKLLGWLSLNSSDHIEVESSIFLFENAFLTFECPDAWINPFPSANGFVWDVAGPPNPNNGHAVLATGYTSQGVQIDTWGLKGIITWAAVAMYCVQNAGGGSYTCLTPDQVAKGASKIPPNGFAWPDLVRDFDAMGGIVPVPSPLPPPVPGQPATLANAQDWAERGIRQDPHSIMTTETAVVYARAGLFHSWPK